MEMTKVEISAVRDVASKVEDAVIELNELELLMVGGGTGDIHLG